MHNAFFHFPVNQNIEPTTIGLYRSIYPAVHMNPEPEVKLTASHMITHRNEYRVIKLLRDEFSSDFLTHILARKAKHGTKIIWDVDDDIWNIPDWNPYQYGEDRLERAEAAAISADVIWTSTQKLAEQMWLRFNRRPVVCPNLISRSVWNLTTFNYRKEDEPLRVLWAGSTTHQEDLEILVDVINELAPTGRFRFLFMGQLPPQGVMKHYPGAVTVVAATKLGDYPPAMRRVNAHVGLCPLKQHIFNECKSSIKYYEYVMSGAPAIASPIGEYSEMDHLILATSTEDWINEISSMLDDEYRKSVHDRQVAEVTEKRSWSETIANQGASHWRCSLVSMANDWCYDGYR